MKYNVGIEIYYPTVARMQQKDGLHARSPQKMAFISEHNKMVHMKITQDFLLKTPGFWDQVI